VYNVIGVKTANGNLLIIASWNLASVIRSLQGGVIWKKEMLTDFGKGGIMLSGGQLLRKCL